MATPTAFVKGQKELPALPYSIVLDSNDNIQASANLTLLKWNLPTPVVVEKDSYILLNKLHFKLTNTANIGDIFKVKLKNASGYRSYLSGSQGPSNVLFINHLEANQQLISLTTDLSRYGMDGLYLPKGTVFNHIQLELEFGSDLSSHLADSSLLIRQLIYGLTIVPIPDK